MNLNKLSRNFVGVLRTTTTNCRVSFIDLYLVFPRNFRIVSLPHTNTLILLELYCGTIRVPGLPVLLSHPSIIFQTGNVYESSSFFNLKEKKIDRKDSRIRTHDPDSPVYSQSTRPLRICWMDKKKFKYI